MSDIVKKYLTVVETLDNDFVEQLKELFSNSVLSVLKVEIEYFIGEDDNKNRYLCIIIISKMFGEIYSVVEPINGYHQIKEKEEDLIDRFLNDMVIVAVGFLYGDAIKQNKVIGNKNDGSNDVFNLNNIMTRVNLPVFLN